ncbi:MAG: sigma-70 family RNA polymerase sigma factor [Burkholderiales bacterium]|jgi:RNA polymerase sigma-70 factor (ECF subfamily)|nr:sigma-70 family RNA polymerase sigma factor [Burkholderiales bacterium]
MLRQRLVRHARFALGDDATAEDLVQETLIAVVARLPQYRGDATLTTWATAILKNKVADWYRSPARVRVTRIDDRDGAHACSPTYDADGGLTGVPPSSQEPSNLVASREMMQALSLCVGAMPPRTARAFLMHDWHGYPTAVSDDVNPLLFGCEVAVFV